MDGDCLWGGGGDGVGMGPYNGYVIRGSTDRGCMIFLRKETHGFSQAAIPT